MQTALATALTRYRYNLEMFCFILLQPFQSVQDNQAPFFIPVPKLKKHSLFK
jgi:hypothetical protein